MKRTDVEAIVACPQSSTSVAAMEVIVSASAKETEVRGETDLE